VRLDKRLILLFTLLTLGAAGLVGAHLTTTAPPPVRTVAAYATAGPDGRFTLQFVGDTMLGDSARPVMRRHGSDWPLRHLTGVLNGDYTIANSEGAITATATPYNRGKDYFYAMRPKALGALSRFGIDAIGLANNHAMDAGPLGLRDSVRNARTWGLPAFGAGPNLAQAERPLMIDSPTGKIAVVGLGENFGSAVTADRRQAGTVAFEPETVQRGVDLARAAGADYVIAYVHWGDNYMPINGQQRYWARVLAAAGYDLVVGAGPHVAQPVGIVNGTPVVFSLGNFVFGTPGRFDTYGQPGVGLVLDVVFGRGLPRLKLRCLRTDNDRVHFQPSPCSRNMSVRMLAKLTPQARIRPNGTGVIATDQPVTTYRPPPQRRPYGPIR
jgi:cyanophycin synthetase